MVITVEQLRKGIRKFVENEIAYKATGVTKFLTFFIIPSLEKEVENMVFKLKEVSVFTEFFNPEGNIYLDEVYSRALQAVEKSGKIVLEQFQISLDRSDIEKIYHYTQGA